MNKEPFVHPSHYATIAKLWPTVESITISVSESNTFLYPESKLDEPKGRSYSASDFCNFSFRCINPDCPCGKFELFDKVSGMIHEGKWIDGDIIKCDGYTSTPNHRCHSILSYKIEIKYKSTNHG